MCTAGGEEDAEVSDILFSWASLTATRRRMPSQPNKSDFVLSTYSSIPPHYRSSNRDRCMRCDMDNKRRKLLGTTYLANSSKSARGEFHPHHLTKGIREEAFALDVGQPRPTCLFFRERNVVPILLCLSVE